jgi:2-keto-3-deoxygluconate permease
MLHMKIKATIEKLPGGMMVIPLILGALIKTFFPQLITIGGFSTAIATNPLAILGVFLVCMGAGMDVKAAPKALKIGAVQTITKFGVAVAVGLSVNYFFGDKGLWGISSLAFIAAMSSTNGGLYTALTAEFGTKEEVGAIAILSIKDGPFLTMIALGSAGLASIPLMTLVGVILPLIIGVVLGNLDPEMRSFLSKAGMVMIPFFAFGLGCGINLETIYLAGFSGVLLGLLTVIVCGFFTILTDKVSGGTGVAGAANASAAGNAVATPAAVAMVDPSLIGTAAIATSQVAAAVIITALLVPVLTAFIARRNKKIIATKSIVK